MEILDFTVVVHRVANRVRLRVPGRRGDAVFFDRLGRTLSRSEGVLSVESNPLTASLIIRHGPTFDLSASALARFGLACTAPVRISGIKGQDLSANHVKLIGLALQVILVAVGRQPFQLAQILAELCLDSVLRQCTRPQETALPFSS
jgi:hypothetical protein